MDKILLTKIILEAIDMANGYAVPEATLRTHVAGLLRPPANDEQWAERIAWLSAPDRRAIIRIPHAVDDELIQWSITERGRVLLATL